MQLYSSIAGGTLGAFLTGLVDRNLADVLAANEPESMPEPVKLARDTDALIVACSETVKALAWRFARSSSLVDVDDMYSIGMLEICESVAAGRLANAANPMGYLVGVARFAMCEEWRRLQGWSTESLDAPLSFSNGDTYTLADLVAAPAPAALGVSKKERALHGAMGRLSPRRRAVIRRRFGLEGRGATSRKGTGGELRTSESNVKQLQRRGLDNLRSDARLCAVVGVEVTE